MTRPRGEIRAALAEAALALHAEQDAATWCEIVARAQVGRVVGHLTVRKMAHAGELERVGRHKPPGAKNWHALYAPVERGQAGNFTTAATGPLDAVLRGWRASC